MASPNFPPPLPNTPSLDSKSGRRTPAASKWLFWVACASITLLIAGVSQKLQEPQRGWVKAPAVIISRDDAPTLADRLGGKNVVGNSPRQLLVVRFTDQNGREQHSDVYYDRDGLDIVDGNKIDIVYNPRYPRQAAVAPDPLFNTQIIIVGALMSLASVLALIVIYRRGRESEALLGSAE